jgi:hypothetical protein
MHTATRLTTFAAGLVAVGAGAAAVGAATGVNPPVTRSESPSHGGAMQEMAPMGAMVAGADGTKLSLGGLTLQPRSVRMSAGRTTTWRFQIAGADGMPVRRFERDQTKLLHLIVARDDMAGYQHLHPQLAPDGTFSIRMKLAHPGRYRAIADFTTGGKRYVLGTDLVAPGTASRATLPPAATTATTDGYRVEMKRPDAIVAGEESELGFTVTRGGRAVTGLQPYLGASGHLVALHAGDLAYSHVHPSGKDLAHGSITFDAELHKAGPYRLFLQFRAGGKVHTAAFTQTAKEKS